MNETAVRRLDIGLWTFGLVSWAGLSVWQFSEQGVAAGLATALALLVLIVTLGVTGEQSVQSVADLAEELGGDRRDGGREDGGGA